MAFTTINDPSENFQTATWTGSSGTDTITFDGNSDLQLDWLWSKSTDNGHSHALMDTSRITSGDYLPLFADTTDIEQSFYDSELQSITSDGFTVGTQPHAGGDGKNYVGFAWKANGGTTSSNSDGSITSTVQANTTAGFSIVTYTSAAGGQTIGHGLGVKPDMYIIKERSTSGDDWFIYHTSLGAGKKLRLSDTNGEQSDTDIWQNTAPTTTVAYLQNDGGGVNQNSGGNQNYVGYFFNSVQGYSKIGTYSGNGNANGPFVYTGFKPAWLLVKRTDGTGDWSMYSNKLGKGNPINGRLEPDNDGTIATGDTNFDFLSNGFKGRDTPAQINASSGTYIYMAFAERPFVTSEGVPTTAR